MPVIANIKNARHVVPLRRCESLDQSVLCHEWRSDCDDAQQCETNEISNATATISRPIDEMFQIGESYWMKREVVVRQMLRESSLRPRVMSAARVDMLQRRLAWALLRVEYMIKRKGTGCRRNHVLLRLMSPEPKPRNTHLQRLQSHVITSFEHTHRHPHQP